MTTLFYIQPLQHPLDGNSWFLQNTNVYLQNYSTTSQKAKILTFDALREERVLRLSSSQCKKVKGPAPSNIVKHTTLFTYQIPNNKWGRWHHELVLMEQEQVRQEFN